MGVKKKDHGKIVKANVENTNFDVRHVPEYKEKHQGEEIHHHLSLLAGLTARSELRLEQCRPCHNEGKYVDVRKALTFYPIPQKWHHCPYRCHGIGKGEVLDPEKRFLPKLYHP